MARVIQVSEFASNLQRKLVRQQNGLWMEVIDAELAEVREVLNELHGIAPVSYTHLTLPTTSRV